MKRITNFTFMCVGALMMAVLFIQCDQESSRVIYEPFVPSDVTTADIRTGKKGVQVFNSSEITAMLQLEYVAGLKADFVGDLANQHPHPVLIEIENHCAHEQTLLLALLDFHQIDLSQANEGVIVQELFSKESCRLYYEEGWQSPENALIVTGKMLEQHMILLYRMDYEKWSFKGLIESYIYSKRNVEEHLKSVVQNLQQIGITYQPEFIPIDMFQDILNGN